MNFLTCLIFLLSYQLEKKTLKKKYIRFSGMLIKSIPCFFSVARPSDQTLYISGRMPPTSLDNVRQNNAGCCHRKHSNNSRPESLPNGRFCNNTLESRIAVNDVIKIIYQPIQWRFFPALIFNQIRKFIIIPKVFFKKNVVESKILRTFF